MRKSLCIASGLIVSTVGLAAPVETPRSPQTPGVVLSENFDEVTPPALPYGWVATNAQGPDPLWVTDPGFPDTAPNAAHVDDPLVVSDKRLDSPPIPITTSFAQLTFRHKYALGCEPCGGLPSGCVLVISGAVLEIAIDGGPFQDVISAGGSFVAHGYNGTVGGTSPLQGRAAWTCGNGLDDYGTTIVDLPPTAVGTTVVLRWRMGSGPPINLMSRPPAVLSYGWWVDSIQLCDGFECGAIPAPAGLHVDTAGNGVWEPGETVDVDPGYFNNGGLALNLSGYAVSLTGPPGATYSIPDASAYYGSIPPGFLGACDFTPDCYSVSVDNPATRPAQHWDAQFAEGLSTGTGVVWALHIGGSFTDVPSSNLFYRAIETVFHNRVTGGCGGTAYCPDDPALRKQMAVFLLKSKYSSAYVPPPATGIFADVPASDPFAPWIENLYNLGITGGCSSSPLMYCPDQAVLRQQMAVFLLKTLLGSGYAPPACTGVFADVPCPSLFANWIEDLHRREIAAGCGNGNFCPDNPNTRGQMAVFLVNTFGLLLYGP